MNFVLILDIRINEYIMSYLFNVNVFIEEFVMSEIRFFFELFETVESFWEIVVFCILGDGLLCFMMDRESYCLIYRL